MRASIFLVYLLTYFCFCFDNNHHQIYIEDDDDDEDDEVTKPTNIIMPPLLHIMCVRNIHINLLSFAV